VLQAPVRSALLPILGNDAYIAQSVLKEVSILLGAMGREYRVAEPLEVRSSVPSPLGTGEIPILGRFTIRAVNARAHRASLGWLMVVDRRQAARLVSGELQAPIDQLADAAAEGREEHTPIDTRGLADTATAALDLDDRGDFDVDTASAWPTRVKHTRSMSAAGASRVDTVEFSRLAG